MAKAVKTMLVSFNTDDRTGLLAEITEKLAEEKVNITAICAYSMDGTAYLDMTTENNAKAKKALEAFGVTVEEDEIVAVEMPNRTGELQQVAKLLAAADINITYLYGTTSTGKASTCLFSTSDNKKAIGVINR